MSEHITEIHDILSLKQIKTSNNLFRPENERSIAGIIPTLMDHCNIDSSSDILKHPDLRNVLNNEVDTADKVLLIIADGFGISHFNHGSTVIRENVEKYQLMGSSTFPSMTSTAMTSLFYGVLPTEHGILGHNIYNENLNSIWFPLRMRYQTSGKIRPVLNELELDQLVTGTSLSQLMYTLDTRSIRVFTPDYLKPPGLGNLLNPDLPRMVFSSHQDAIRKVKLSMLQDKTTFIILYLPDIDTAGHIYGPKSDESEKAVQNVEKTIDQLVEYIDKLDDQITMVVTADHGQVTINDNQSKIMSQSNWKNYRDNGTLLSSSGRVIHGYSIDNNVEKTYDHLIEISNNMGIVIDNEQAMNLAGGNTQFDRRMGDYVLIYDDNHLYGVSNCISQEKDKLPAGQHGSLTLDELVVPIAVFSNS